MNVQRPGLAIIVRCLPYLFAAIGTAGCASAPFDYPKTASSALVNTEETSLARLSAEWRAEDPGRNGFYSLVSGFDALGSRLALMERAERSLDAQYFLMKPDDAGLLFAATMLEAADRGVRVRFLLDDVFTTVDDRELMVLNEHPNIELRLFNPISRKGVYAFNYLGHFRVANRRMHNKTFTIDNQVAIVGGRNIANEYFELQKEEEFVDFDMFTAGPIVEDISASFDAYWNHELAVPLDAFYDAPTTGELTVAREEIDQAMQQSGDDIFTQAINTDLLREFDAGRVKPYVADARVIIDDPQKLLEEISEEQQIVATEIAAALDGAQEEIIVFTPYFIPGDDGVEFMRTIIDKGVRVVLVTNSLGTNNHTSVHSAYTSYRKSVLRAGVELWEARADAAQLTLEDGTTQFDQLTMHTKGILIDRRYIFVGSLNLDPRSIDINTEMGIMIDSEALAGILADQSLRSLPEMAYRVDLDDRNRLRWHAVIDGQQIVETHEPLTTGWRRFTAWFLKIAPEKQL